MIEMGADLKISVIIPTWKEAANLPRTLQAVFGQNFEGELEVIVVDGGSSDETLKVAESLGTKVMQSARRRRSTQMNLGASAAQGEIFLFLHADTIVPGGGFEAMLRGISEAGVCGGGFARRFDSQSLFLKMTCWLAEIRNRSFGWHLGDQAIFCRAEAFKELGGFRDWDRFEDLDFSRRLGGRGKIVTVRPPVVSSARRFEREGAWKRTMRDFLLTVSYLRGKPEAIENAQARTDQANCETRMGAH